MTLGFGTVIMNTAHYAASLSRRHGVATAFPSVNITAENGSLRFAFAGNEPKRPVAKGVSDAERRRLVGRRGIDKQVVGGWLDLFGYDLRRTKRRLRFLNEHMRKGNRRLPFFVPLRPCRCNPASTPKVLEALDQGFHGAMIGTQPKGATGVSTTRPRSVLEAASRRRRPCSFIHLRGARRPPARLWPRQRSGRVTDTTITMSRLLYSGHLTLPGVGDPGGAARDGARPAAPQLCDRARAERRSMEASAGISTASSTRRRCASSASSPATTKSSGTDLPFAIAEPEPIKFVDACHSRERAFPILGDTASKLFQIGQ
jgi:aminocarboxymuconate-semialdehyde decarboxylase